MILQHKLANFQVILASKSPRRHELLKGMDIHFHVISKDVDESFPSEMPVKEIAGFLSQKKSAAFNETELPENFLLITADTVVIIGDKVLNKPAYRDEAISMILALSGRTHQVITGVTIRTKENSINFSECSEVTFGALADEEIALYVDNYQPFDKAGAYGIQEWIGYVAIKSVKGSFYNVMGLPTHQLYEALKNI